MLTVDDHPSVRRLLTVLAEQDERFGTVTAAGHAAEALQHAADDQPDVIVLDANLGRDNGLTILPALRSAAPGAVIAIYSSAPFADAASSRAAGADGYVEKGTDPDVLLDRLVAMAEARSA
jgi:two-component system nitrate/nitrite response regulator NarL